MIDIIDLHTHTTASGHAYSSLTEMVSAASQKGLSLVGSSDHAPGMPGACHAFYFSNFKVIPREMFGIKLIMGCELSIVDYQGTVDLEESILQRLDYSIASIHAPCYTMGNVSQNTDAYLGAIKNPYVNIIGHPDDSRFPYDYDTIAAAAKEHHKLLEVNSSSLHPSALRQNAALNYKKLLEFCKHYRTPIIINSDAHIDLDVGNHTRAISLLTEIDFPLELIVNRSLEALDPYLPNVDLLNC